MTFVSYVIQSYRKVKQLASDCKANLGLSEEGHITFSLSATQTVSVDEFSMLFFQLVSQSEFIRVHVHAHVHTRVLVHILAHMLACAPVSTCPRVPVYTHPPCSFRQSILSGSF